MRKVLEAITGKGLASKKGRPLGVSSFWKLLTHPFYCGRIRLNGELLNGLHEPLVDRAASERVQRNLHKRRRRG